MIQDERICVCGDEESEHITMKDGSVYCHACWFNADIRDEEAIERSKHVFNARSVNEEATGE